MIRNGINQANLDSGNRPERLASDEKEELERLKRESRKVRQEREIL